MFPSCQKFPAPETLEPNPCLVFIARTLLLLFFSLLPHQTIPQLFKSCANILKPVQFFLFVSLYPSPSGTTFSFLDKNFFDFFSSSNPLTAPFHQTGCLLCLLSSHLNNFSMSSAELSHFCQHRARYIFPTLIIQSVFSPASPLQNRTLQDVCNLASSGKFSRLFPISYYSPQPSFPAPFLEPISPHFFFLQCFNFFV